MGTKANGTLSTDVDLSELDEPVGGTPSLSKLGRYDIVCELGSGGMANVYLARVAGPAGFENWFAIKRIHRHLAKDRDFVNMFLDEARIAAAVRHPNVARVFELGQDGREYFLAMEYLEGEHLGTLMKTAWKNAVEVRRPMAAWIIAEAADGLHHAHEARDSRGRALELVHRDVSPQNIFLTYDGAVKLTDFGVAKAANRLATTQSGGIKGKFAYMSPEQARGRGDIDRRTDIWALGVVLWELTTGQRLFGGAASDGDVYSRVMEGDVPLPLTMDDAYPLELEHIVMRALAAKAEDRYPTAAALAKELRAYVRSAAEVPEAAELSTLMTRLFAQRVAQKLELRQAVSERSAAPTVQSEGERSTSGVVSRPAETSTTYKLPRRSVLPLLLVGAAVVGGGGAVVLWASGSEEVEPAEPPLATVRVDSRPSGAAVFIDGVEQDGTTPLLADDVTPGRHRIELTLAGHERHEATFDVEDRVELSYALTAAGELPDEAADEIEVVEAEAQTTAVAENEAEPEQLPPSAEPTPRMRTRTAATMAPAYINIITRPWAEAWVNGRSVGNTPIVRREIPSGAVRVRLQREGMGPSRTVRRRVEPGQTLVVQEDL